MKIATRLDWFCGLLKDRLALRDAVAHALDAFERAGNEHGCDYCRADASVMRRALEASDRETERQMASQA